MNLEIYKECIIDRSTDKSYEKIYCNSSFCSHCQGKYCCNTMGCGIDPKDLKEISISLIIKLLQSDIVCIDRYFDDEENSTMFLRIKNIDNDIFSFDYGFGCMLQTEYGCPLSFGYRPREARELIPNYDHTKCQPVYTREQCAKDWEPYQEILTDVAIRFLD